MKERSGIRGVMGWLFQDCNLLETKKTQMEAIIGPV
jgi:hypothetical protein